MGNNAATGVLLPHGLQGAGPDLVRFTQRVEELGYESFWVPEVAGRELMATAGWLLASTSRLRIGSGIASVYARDASTARMGSHTLSELSGGRFELTLGVSVRWLVEQRGQVWEKPLAKAASYLDAYHATEVDDPPPPAAPAPLYFAAHGPRIIDTVKDRVDGLMTINVPPEHTADVRAAIGPDKRLIVVKTVLPITDPEAARARAREVINVYLRARQYWTLWPKYGYDEANDNIDGGSDRLVDMLVAWGDTGRIAAQIQHYYDAGASDVVLRIPDDPAESIRWPLLEELAPSR